MHSALKDKEGRISEMIEQREARRDEMDYIEEANFDFFCEDIGTEISKLSQLSYSSFILLWYSCVEAELIRFCRKLGMPPEYSKGTGIGRAKEFFKERGYQIDNTHWEKLKGVRKLRNLLAHSGNVLDLYHSRPKDNFTEYSCESEEVRYVEMKKHALTYLRNNNMITEFSRHIEIDPKPQYCEELIELASDLFQKIHNDFK
jgi:hypothetical protein